MMKTHAHQTGSICFTHFCRLRQRSAANDSFALKNLSTATCELDIDPTILGK